nr:universal stress protein [Roseibium sp. RKSG952]
MVPIDLAHANKLTKAVEAAAGLAAQHNAPIVFVAVTASTPGPLAHNPDEFAKRLDDFAQQQATKYGISAEARTVVTHDPAVDLNNHLIRAIKDTGADVVVMASHIPNVADHIWPSHGGTIATHTNASVFLVREQ